MQFETTISSSPALSGVRTIVDRLVRKRLVLGRVALALIGAGLFWQWSWLVAIGVAPVRLSLAPCAAMCALGLCMNKMTGSKSYATGQQADKGPREIVTQNTKPDPT